MERDGTVFYVMLRAVTRDSECTDDTKEVRMMFSAYDENADPRSLVEAAFLISHSDFKVPISLGRLNCSQDTSGPNSRHQQAG